MSTPLALWYSIANCSGMVVLLVKATAHGMRKWLMLLHHKVYVECPKLLYHAAVPYVLSLASELFPWLLQFLLHLPYL